MVPVVRSLAILDESMNLEADTRSQRGQRGDAERTRRVDELFLMLMRPARMSDGLLSGCEQQVFAVSRGLQSTPSPPLLNELPMILSPLPKTAMFTNIRRIAKPGRTILIVEQNVSEARGIPDYGYVLKNGAVGLHGKAMMPIRAGYLRQTYPGA